MRSRHGWFLLMAASVAAIALARCSSSSNPTGPTYGTPTSATTPTPVTTPTATPATTPMTAQGTIAGFAFGSLTVAVGTSVTWMNMDSAPHTATSDASSAFQFDTGTIAPGATSGPIVFNTAGTFPYHCNVHPSMHATIVVH